MSSNNRNRQWAGGVGMAVGTAFVAALIGLANAPAATADTEPDPFKDLFGDTGFNSSWTPSADSFLNSNDPTLAASMDQTVDNFLASEPVSLNFPEGDDPFSYFAFELDPSAFNINPGDPIYLGASVPVFPTDGIGDFAVGLDYTLFASGLAPTLDTGISDSLNFLANLPGTILGWLFFPEDLLPLLLLAGA